MVWPKNVKKVVFRSVKFVLSKPGLKRVANSIIRKDTYIYKRLYEGYCNYLQLSDGIEQEKLPIPTASVQEERVELAQLLQIMPINQISILLKIIECDNSLSNGEKYENCN